jgi:hypothetical protein
MTGRRHPEPPALEPHWFQILLALADQDLCSIMIRLREDVRYSVRFFFEAPVSRRQSSSRWAWRSAPRRACSPW